ncbi:N-acetylmuramoyl-L-alanine amidase [Ureibacillus acetophenoni]|uniref:N-acetylmuramoyl-L-alanine amidase n=1 Tax=Ureibacillus acetophenoni TaxID=614649 RepID=A0A285U0F6_9BACL|nr:N-acetylmuramoyl-L-alanine amidase [Ureibacillus acetophenoni]SOC34878.1 N-acetylmuramoyl-L-alanine amidase [Ureibacillus acetophenoni]
MSIKKVRSIFMLALMSIAFMLVPNVNAKAALSFPDVPSSLLGSEEIYYLVDLGIINGIPAYNGTGGYVFKPTDSVSKGQAAKMVIIAGGYEPLDVTESSFTDIDVKKDAWMSGYVEKAVSLGFFNTITDGKFKPHESLTRGEMSKVLATALKLDVEKYVSQDSPFSDITKTNPYHKYISALYYNGITNGVSAGPVKKFNPSGALSRREFSMFVARGLSEEFRLPEGEVAGVHVPNEKEYIGKVISNENYLNVRSSKSTSDRSNLVGQVHKGHNFDAYAVEGDWIKVVHEGKYAYIWANYASFVDENGKALGLKQSTVTATEDLSVYVKSNEDSNKIGIFSEGKSIDVYGKTGDWYLTKVNGLPGYVKVSQTTGATVEEEKPVEGEEPNVDEEEPVDNEEEPEVEEEKPVEPEQPVVTNLIGRTTANSVRVRAQPNTSDSSEIVGTLNRGDEVSVLSINGNWAKILYKGKEAHVHKRYLKLLNQSGSPLAGRIIVLDPGHGGKDPGAVSGPYQEKQIVFTVTSILKQKLEEAGATVYMTRVGDTYPTLQDRVKFAHDKYAEIFVSIHVNSATSSSALGTETFYSVTANDNEKEDYALASNINSQIVNNAQMVDRKVKRKDWYVVANSLFPSVLVELGFISNQYDRAKLTSPEYQEIYADSIYQGILNYYSN